MRLSLTTFALFHSKIKDMEEQIKQLEQQLTGDMIKDMAIRDAIHNIKMKLNGTKPSDQHIECIGCGS